MTQQHAVIWLQPWCDGCEKHSSGEGRQWCQDDAWGQCEECDQKSERYVLAHPDGEQGRAPKLDTQEGLDATRLNAHPR